MTEISVSWEQFKSIKAGRSLTIRYVIADSRYLLFMSWEHFVFQSVLMISDSEDFEANFKDSAELVVDLTP